MKNGISFIFSNFLASFSRFLPSPQNLWVIRVAASTQSLIGCQPARIQHSIPVFGAPRRYRFVDSFENSCMSLILQYGSLCLRGLGEVQRADANTQPAEPPDMVMNQS
ncbi:MAG TPA: hypothetical protein VGZ29_01940, partial [Terriglobia bacterium]|nr:hypothetical protein [Terriglobia bacterium]